MTSLSQSEDLLDVDQITLQEASLPPPIQRVMDPGQFSVIWKDWLTLHVWSNN